MLRRRVILTLGLVSLASHSALALELSWAPQLRVGTRATDNVLWSLDESESAWAFDTGGGLLLKMANPEWTSTLNPSFNFRRFAIGENLDADEYGVRSQHEYKITERLQATLQADYTRDSTLSSELADAGERNDVANRDSVTIGPGMNFLLSDVTALSASYLFSDVSFDATAGQGLVDYKFQQWSASGNHYITSQFRVFVSGFITDFDTAPIASFQGVPPTGSETWTYGGMVGVNYDWSSTFSTSGSVGFQTSSTDFVKTSFLPIPGTVPEQVLIVQNPVNEKSNGPIANFGMKKVLEDTRAEFTYARRVSPSIRGAQTVEDDMVLTADHDINRSWLLGFRGGYNMRTAQAEQIGGAVRDLNRDQATVGGYLTYRATKELSVRGEYRFTRQTLSESGEHTYVNALFVTMIFNGMPHSYQGF
ncbi:MAG: hypothetical protein K2Z81_25495 [Cyanobacteria bacterium]|nr:hypothetical protein [Cyanobacteriota bacterium]